MKVKDILKEATIEGAKLGGKTLVKSAFDLKTWVALYLAFFLTRGYNKFCRFLDEEADLNRDAAGLIEKAVSTPKGMNEVCQKYQLTDEQVREVIKTQKELSHTQKAKMKTAKDLKRDFRSWLIGYDRLLKVGQAGSDPTAQKQATLALDAYEQAEKEHSQTNTIKKATDHRKNR